MTQPTRQIVLTTLSLTVINRKTSITKKRTIKHSTLFLYIINTSKTYSKMHILKKSYLILFILFFGCSQRDNINTLTVENAKLGQEAFKKALFEEKQGNYWSAINEYDRSINYFNQSDSTELKYYTYLAYRFRAKMLSSVNLDSTAASSMDKALKYLNSTPYLPSNTSLERERTGTLRYKASYLRNAGKYGESNALLINLLQFDDVVEDQQLHIKNLIGMNFQSLGDNERAYEYFTNVLRKKDIDPTLKSYYLNNRSYVAYHTGRKDIAYQDIGEAIGIIETLELNQPEMLFRMNLGEYQMLDGRYSDAEESFARALSVYSTVDQQPDLFKIYRLRSISSAAVGNLKASNENYLKFDQLEKANLNAIRRYNGKQELAILEAKLAGLKIQEERAAWIAELRMSKAAFYVLLAAFAVVVGFTMIVIKAWNRKQAYFASGS